MMTERGIYSNLAIPPGEYLEEVLDDLGMSKEELAQRMGRPASKLSEIYKGAKSITPETALQLEQALGVPAHIWTGLESEYRLILAEARREEQLKGETGFVKKFCYQDLVKTGVVERFTAPKEKVRALQSFFGVTSLENVMDLRRYKAAFRYGQAGERSLEAVAAWLRMGERKAQELSCSPYNEKRLSASLDQLRSLTQERPKDFQPKLNSLLSECGVALVVCPHFPKTKAHGATFWLKPDKAVLMITIRRGWADIFWFSLFHEIAHILFHDRQDVILEDNEGDSKEKEADAFASNTLIPSDVYEDFLSYGDVTLQQVQSFARKVGIHPGIVVGRLQHKERKGFNWGNGLRCKLVWAD